MKTVMEREKYFLLAMTVVSLMLAGVLLWEWEQGMNLKRDLLKMRKIPVADVPAQKILSEFSLPDLENGFPELLSRPVFAVSRRAFVAPVQADAGVMKKGQFVLVGVLISPGQRSALLRDVATGKTETVAQVGLIRGMALGDVQSNRVVLRQGEETEELLLNVLTGPKLPQRALGAPAPASAPRPAASSAVPAAIPASSAKPAMPASAPKPLTAQELIQAEKKQQADLEQIKKQGPSVPPNLPPSAAPK